MKDNVEQLEADEINKLPRIVITIDDVMYFPQNDKTLVLSREEIECASRLAKALERESSRK
jgi:hypothetical protein